MSETVARAWAVSRSDGLALGFTDHDRLLAFDGITFRPDSGLTARAVVQSSGLSEPLNRQQGRVYHARCSADLGDGMCRFDLSRTGYSAEGVVQSLEDGQRFVLSGVAALDSGWFEHGRILVLSGGAQGLSGVVKGDLPIVGGRREVELWTGLGIQPVVGDRVKLIAGCDKRGETCRMKFLNYLNFRGFPHLPPEDWLIAPRVNR
jgi:uncharacterized phage protein (TIGR02218 family)